MCRVDTLQREISYIQTSYVRTHTHFLKPLRQHKAVHTIYEISDPGLIPCVVFLSGLMTNLSNGLNSVG